MAESLVLYFVEAYRVIYLVNYQFGTIKKNSVYVFKHCLCRLYFFLLSRKTIKVKKLNSQVYLIVIVRNANGMDFLELTTMLVNDNNTGGA